MIKQYLINCFIFLAAFSAHSQLTEATATSLARLPLHCIGNEYPNKANHTADTEADARLLPHELHPSFYGCLDWHSSVHGHWLLLKVLEKYPNIAIKDSIIQVLNTSFEASRIVAEAGYFTKYKNTKTFERTYGWAWILKLDQELRFSTVPEAKQWYLALQPLTQKVVELWKEFLPKQTYPNRTGVHPNTAFGLVFALDWARALGDTSFENAIVTRSKNYYASNTATPAYLEPDGTDFLSPSLEIADLMSRVYDAKKFLQWFNLFYTPKGIQQITTLPFVSDRTDMQIVHLDGLALSRAWCMKSIAEKLPAAHPLKKLFAQKAAEFLQKTLPNVTIGNYGGDHWLASFALYALD
ncbi:MAG: DUF2891 domain-containing protein [Chitinophagaceae bacterium]